MGRDDNLAKPAANRPRRARERLANMFAALSATNEAILRATSREALYEQVCEAALRGGNFALTAILLREPEADMLRVAAGAGEGLDQLRAASISVSETSPEGSGLAGIAFRTQQPCLSNDFLNDERSKAWHEEARKRGIRSAAALPLIRAGRSVGVLVVAVRAEQLDDETVALLTRISENVTFALDNFDREAEREKSERATRRLARMFAALSATNEAILRAKNSDELYQLVCDAAVHGGKSLAATVLLTESGSHWLRPVAGTGAIIELVKQTRFSIDPENPYGKGICGSAFRTRKPQVNRDVLNSEQARPWRESSRQSGVVACAAFPLVKGGQSVGVLMFFIKKSWAADEEVIALLARLAENVSAALDNFEREAERKRAEARAQYLAMHDDLTGLPNRAMFSQLLQQAIKAGRRYGRKFAVMFIDLDRFKIINDTLGHGAGDLLIKDTAARLKDCLRQSDVVARLGGDEFVVLLQETKDTSQVGAIAKKVLSTIVKPLVIHEQECRVTASIGISMFPTDAEDEQSLTKHADAAMYLAKEQGRSSFRFYSKDIKTQSIERLMLETSLRRALERNEFLLYYQAKQDLRTRNISGVEALLRWRHPDLGIMLPNQFIPLAEETGLIVPIGRWVLETACGQNSAWRKQGLPPIRIAVNLSPRQFADEHFLSSLSSILKSANMPPELLELEITESMVMQNVGRAVWLLGALKKMGIRLAIDDFGTGYSSMSLIKQFPIDTIKVDQSFIREIPTDPDDRAITEAIIALGKALDLTIVAEGVETQEQEKFLREHACDEIQGYIFSTPIPGDDFVTFLARHNLSLLEAQAAKARLSSTTSTSRARRAQK
jgi:diguanylate cyclase (GGDEF)-like protein